MGRTATGVRGIRLAKEDEVVGMEILEEDNYVLVVTENGFGKRTPAAEYRIQTRGGRGLITCNITERTGAIVAVETVIGDEDLMLITAGGVLIRTAVDSISVLGRNTQGVTLIRVNEEEYVATVAKVEKVEDEIEEDENEEAIEGITEVRDIEAADEDGNVIPTDTDELDE